MAGFPVYIAASVKPTPMLEKKQKIGSTQGGVPMFEGFVAGVAR